MVSRGALPLRGDPMAFTYVPTCRRSPAGAPNSTCHSSARVSPISSATSVACSVTTLNRAFDGSYVRGTPCPIQLPRSLVIANPLPRSGNGAADGIGVGDGVAYAVVSGGVTVCFFSASVAPATDKKRMHTPTSRAVTSPRLVLLATRPGDAA